VHQQLAVAAQHVELADVAVRYRCAFFVRQLIFTQQALTIILVAPLHLRVAVQVVEEFLGGVEAHGGQITCTSGK
jgi:hypothetical protein